VTQLRIGTENQRGRYTCH